MSKGKLEKFAEIGTFPNVFQLPYLHSSDDFSLKGIWRKEYFKNENPLVLELGCGKGEYTVGLAEKFPYIKFEGIDISEGQLYFAYKKAKKFKNYHPKKGDYHDLNEFPKQSFNIVFEIEAVCYSLEKEKVLKEVSLKSNSLC